MECRSDCTSGATKIWYNATSAPMRTTHGAAAQRRPRRPQRQRCGPWLRPLDTRVNMTSGTIIGHRSPFLSRPTTSELSQTNLSPSWRAATYRHAFSIIAASQHRQARSVAQGRSVAEHDRSKFSEQRGAVITQSIAACAPASSTRGVSRTSSTYRIIKKAARMRKYSRPLSMTGSSIPSDGGGRTGRTLCLACAS